ncbi:leucine--tRNA ligase [Patescibacteria group bacterium]|nr:leucine--tRNA ligase [Patescibacteria group bacterium]
MSQKDEQKYNPVQLESKWQKVWESKNTFSLNLDNAKNPFYNLMMFPYPSAEGLHAGNMYAFVGADIRARFMRMKGYDVFEPIGLDGFGIHSENYALKIGKHPIEQAEISEKNFYRQLHSIGNSFDWKHTVETYDSNYYKWTQWIFAEMFKKGLAYKKKASVNWCPSCKTVLADEQVISKSKENTETIQISVCERCDTEVIKKDLEQWFFKITDYADRLLNNAPKLNWSEIVKIAQINWIGKSEGAKIEFRIQNSEFRIPVFTTRPDTLFGATFLVLSPEHPIVSEILDWQTNLSIARKNEILKYIDTAKKKSEQERAVVDKEKTGVFIGVYTINPVTKKEIPIWIADYVVMGYGTGVIMAVPAHDLRDYDFAKKYKLEIKEVIKGGNILKEAYVGSGEIVNSGDWDGWKVPQNISKAIKWIQDKELGKKEVNFHLRDWLISRQRYWGPPIPMVFCSTCADQGISWADLQSPNSHREVSKPAEWNSAGWFPVGDEDLPVKLPYIENYKPIGTGGSPLATHPEFYNTKCPNCKNDAVRETDVSDTFLDSAWYFLRYVSTETKDKIFSKERIKKWLPVDIYIGGAEHAVLHLLYSRFVTMFLYDLNLIDFEEPYKRFFAHGLLIKEGAKMSKSKGNVITPDKYIAKFGADTLRCYLMFIGQFSQGGDFYDTGIEGMNRFLKRVWTLFTSNVELVEKESDKEALKMLHKTIKGVTKDIDKFSYNTAIAKLMELYNFTATRERVGIDFAISYLKLLAPFAPHITEDLFQRFTNKNNQSSIINNQFNSIHLSKWPEHNPKFLEEDEVLIVVQVNGKIRETLKVKSEKSKDKGFIEKKAKESKKVQSFLKGKVKRVVYIPGKIFNFVIEES